ncbi:hypothetical protein E2C01_084302 [Portunus trituberculatus]|uniref:Uncharacterized protein n=1 Tax=Portunus trituberculatus TaxID=210409 RepID=A0A5B7IXX6_PORTR|nr:hypothetical protein [Portunus trituberculatus]
MRSGQLGLTRRIRTNQRVTTYSRRLAGYRTSWLVKRRR